MAERQEMMKLLDCRDMVHFYTDFRATVETVKPVWDAYVGLPEIKDLEFASAPDDEVVSLVVGFNSGPYHEALLHLESTITVFHMLWNDCPKEIRNKEHCRYVMGGIAASFAPRLKDAEGQLFFVKPDEFGSAPMSVLETLVESRKVKIKDELREIRRAYQEKHGEASIAMPTICPHTQFVRDFINTVFDGMTDFEEVGRVMAIRTSKDGRDILYRPEWKFWQTYLFHANRLATGFINDITAIQNALCECCCSSMKGYAYVQAVGRPVQRVYREQRGHRAERQGILSRGFEKLQRRK